MRGVLNGALIKSHLKGKNRILREKLAPLPLCPPQIPYGLASDCEPGLP